MPSPKWKVLMDNLDISDLAGMVLSPQLYPAPVLSWKVLRGYHLPLIKLCENIF